MAFSGLREAVVVMSGLALLGTPLLADSVFGYSANGLQTFTAATSGVYQITVDGASGGNSGQAAGGYGASLVQDVTLTAGEVLDLYVGQAGISGHNGGGGGGTFVFINGVPLIVSGGGGGAANDGNDGALANGGNAQLGTDGGTPGGGGAGGTGMNGGAGVPALFGGGTGGGGGGGGFEQFRRRW